MKFRLIENWQKAYKFLSTQFAALIILANTLYGSMDIIRTSVPEGWMVVINGVLGALVILGRIKAQSPTTEPQP